MKIFGIDPGLSGAIAILEKKKVLSLFDMPVMAEGKKNKKQLNSAQLVDILRENSIGDDEIAEIRYTLSLSILLKTLIGFI